MEFRLQRGAAVAAHQRTQDIVEQDTWMLSPMGHYFHTHFLFCYRASSTCICHVPKSYGGECWKLNDTVVILNLIDIYRWFCLSIHKQTCMRHVFYCPINGTVPRAHNGTFSKSCFRISRGLWVGGNRSVVVKSFNQVNKPWVNKNAWYNIVTFSTMGDDTRCNCLGRRVTQLCRVIMNYAFNASAVFNENFLREPELIKEYNQIFEEQLNRGSVEKIPWRNQTRKKAKCTLPTSPRCHPKRPWDNLAEDRVWWISKATWAYFFFEWLSPDWGKLHSSVIQHAD